MMALPDYTRRNIVFRHLDECSDHSMPREGRELVAMFATHTLPSWISEDIQRTLFHLHRSHFERFQERLISARRISGPAGPGEHIEGLVGIVYDVMSCVKDVQQRLTLMRSLGRSSTYMYHHVMGFVRACLRAACPDAFLLGDVLFALSRSPYASGDPLSRFLPYYSTATFGFVSFGSGACTEKDNPTDISDPSPPSLRPFLHPALRAAPAAVQAPHDKRAPPPPIPSDYNWTLEEWLALGQRGGKSEYDSRQSLRSYTFPSVEDIAHKSTGESGAAKAPETELLARHGTDKICVLVVGQSTVIARALASAVYHRCALGVKAPIMGLVVDPYSPTIRLAVAWPDDIRESVDDLPAVHIAWTPPEGSRENPPFGIYNLASCHSALLLASSISAQRANFESDIAAANVESDVTKALFAWRTDRIRPAAESSVSGSDLDHVVSTWAKALPDFRVVALPCHGRELDMERGPDEGDVESKGKAGGKADSWDDVVAEQPDVKLLDEAGHSGSDQNVPNVRTLSCSAMAAKCGSKEEPEPTWTWLQYRNSITLTMPSPWLWDLLSREGEHDVPQRLRNYFLKMRPHLEVYNDYMSLKASDFVLEVPDLVDPALQYIGRDLSEFLQTLGISDGPPDISPSAVSTFLRKYFQDIVRLVADARIAKKKSQTQKISEAHFREFWDCLLERCLHNPDDASAPVSALYEEDIQLPRNEVYDRASTGPERDGSLRALRRRYIELLISEESLYWGLQDEPSDHHNEIGILSAISTAAVNLFEQVNGRDQSLGERSVDHDLLAKRMALEPRIARCDALGVVRVPDVFRSAEESPSIFRTILRAPSTHVGKTNAPGQDHGVTDTQQLRHFDLGRGPPSPSDSHDPFATIRPASVSNKQEALRRVRPEDSSTVTHSEAEVPPTADANTANPARRSIELVDEGVTAPSGAPSRKRIKLEDAAPPTSSEPEMDHQLAHPTASPPPRDPSREVPDVHPTDLYVPFLAVEYKKDNPEVPRKGPNQLRTYNTAMPWHRWISGLGLLTEGTVGVVTCTYTDYLSKGDDTSPATNKTYKPLFTHIMERNAFAFDVSKPEDALNFAVFLFRLSRTHGAKLVNELGAHCEAIRNGQKELPRWTQNNQNTKLAKASAAVS